MQWRQLGQVQRAVEQLHKGEGKQALETLEQVAHKAAVEVPEGSSPGVGEKQSSQWSRGLGRLMSCLEAGRKEEAQEALADVEEGILADAESSSGPEAAQHWKQLGQLTSVKQLMQKGRQEAAAGVVEEMLEEVGSGVTVGVRSGRDIWRRMRGMRAMRDAVELLRKGREEEARRAMEEVERETQAEAEQATGGDAAAKVSSLCSCCWDA